MSKQHTPTPRSYLQNAINRINDLIPLAELGIEYQDSNFYHPDQKKTSRESIGMAKRFVEYVSNQQGEECENILKAVNSHDRLVKMIERMLPYTDNMIRGEVAQLLTELKS